uniref:Uncharacterized protein n=1 Tax=Sphaerodactylus townsendi TaxID=933632 RepID=A0ACB8EG82_9SAUR
MPVQICLIVYMVGRVQELASCRAVDLHALKTLQMLLFISLDSEFSAILALHILKQIFTASGTAVLLLYVFIRWILKRFVLSKDPFWTQSPETLCGRRRACTLEGVAREM